MPQLPHQSVSATPGESRVSTVLLLDDEVRIVDILRLILRPHYRVLTATDGHTALQLLKNNPVQVIISDQRMPRMTGVEFLRQARTISPTSVRILLTGFSDLRAIIDSINEGEVFRFLMKPWGNTELLAIVRDAMDVARQLESTPAASFAELASTTWTPEPAKKTASDTAGKTPAASRPSASSPQGHVLVKTTNNTLFEQIRRTQPESIGISWVTSLEEALAFLSRQNVMAFVVHFESAETTRDEEAMAFVKILKHKRPTLMTIALVRNADAYDAISLINQGRVFRFVTLPCKATQVGIYIQSALRQSQALAATPQFLETQRADAIDASEETRTPGLFERISEIFRRWIG
ncbi:MAG: response regulator [Zoogloeaceae bacterium]|jgi:DNA-binding NtrC family response regulator|nr:response regulator [Zoogloeaceae bacterium]